MKINAKTDFRKSNRDKPRPQKLSFAAIWPILKGLAPAISQSDASDPLYDEYFDALDAVIELASSGAHPDNRFRAVYDSRRTILKNGASGLSEEFSGLISQAKAIDVLSASIAATEAGGNASTMSVEIRRKMRRGRSND